MRQLRIFIDLHDVLSIFVEEACRWWGLSLQAVEDVWGPNKGHTTIEAVSAALGRDHPMTPVEFWTRLNEVGFWGDLSVTPWAHELINLVADITPEWYIATRPQLDWSCYAGTHVLVERLFPNHVHRVIPIQNKSLLAQDRNCVLIDDSEANINAFIDAGGDGILFPHWVNSKYEHRHDPMPHVKADLAFIRSKADA